MIYKTFKEEEIPYDILERYGVTRGMVEDFPTFVSDRFMAGMFTPKIRLSEELQNGTKAYCFAYIAMKRMADNSVGLRIAGEWKAVDLGIFNDKEKQQLLDGKVVKVKLPDKGINYAQFDDAIQQVMTVPYNFVQNNIYNYYKNQHSDTITKEMIDRLYNGEIVEFEDKAGNILSIGIDLNDFESVRIADGDISQWIAEKKDIVLPKYSFGIYGCWMTDDSGGMTYYNEDEYTEEMKAAQKYAGSQNMVRHQIEEDCNNLAGGQQKM